MSRISGNGSKPLAYCIATNDIGLGKGPRPKLYAILIVLIVNVHFKLNLLEKLGMMPETGNNNDVKLVLAL